MFIEIMEGKKMGVNVWVNKEINAELICNTMS